MQPATPFLALTVSNPLEQFEVTLIPGLSWTAFTNLSLTMALNMAAVFVLLGMFSLLLQNNYDVTLRAIYQLVASMVKENLQLQKQIYFTTLLFLFVFILTSNVAGMIPFSFTPTSSFAVTFFIANTHFTGLNLVGATQHGWEMMNLFLPSGAPLAITPFLIIIEAVSYIARVFSLSVRLFANMMSGHALLKILIGFSWAMLTAGTVMAVLALFPWVIVTAIMYLELLIAFLQSYVFTILITLYINDVLSFH